MKKFGIFLAAVILTFGCARQIGVVQSDSESKLLFTGNIQNSVLILDGNEVGQLDRVAEVFDYKSGKAVQFTLEPGTHDIEVQQDGKLRVSRKLYLNDQQTMEVVVP